jgi:DNA-binding transcriptional MerR regulator
MLKIGEFAWLGQEPVETLRHYDRIGLLWPAHSFF